MNSLFNIEKLNEQNYESWRLQMRSVLVHQELWLVVSGTWKLPKQSEKNAEQIIQWQSKDEKALATIMLSVSTGQLAHIKNCATSASAWSSLLEVHRPQGPMQKVTLFKQLIRKEMKNGDCVQEYVNEFNEIVDKLTEVGIELQEELIVIMLLASLPKSFENFVVALETRDELPKLSLLKIKLIEESERRKSFENENDNDNEKVFSAKPYNNKNSSNKQYTREYQEPKNSDRQQQLANNNIQFKQNNNKKCYNCGMRGHFAANCKAKAKTKNDFVLTSTLAISHANVKRTNTWCVDSGATSHLCCDKNRFTNLIAQRDKIMLAGNKYLESEGYGTVSVNFGVNNVMLKNVLYVPDLQYNFISVSKVLEKDCIIKFDKQYAKIYKNNYELLCAQNINGLFLVKDGDEDEHRDEGCDLPRTRGRPKTIYTGKPGRPRKQYHTLNSINASEIAIPQTAQEALNCEQSEMWKTSMQEEFESLIKNNTWTMVELPENKTAIGCRWVYSVKQNPDGSVERFKSRLVAKGCSQRQGIDYDETFSPVVRHATIRMVIALAAKMKLHLHQMDVTTAYLHSELTDEVYMKQPDGYVDIRNPNSVLKLNKAIYGLKQSGRAWNTKLDAVLRKIDFLPCVNEPCLYYKNGDSLNLIAVYVDDLILASSNKNELLQIKAKIAEELDVVDKGMMSFFLGMEVERDGEVGDIYIGQQKYIKDLLSRYDMTDCRKVATPLDVGFKVTKEIKDGRKVNPTKYQKLIGELLYLAIMTRPDLIHAVCKLSQCNKEPYSEHEAAAKHILRYLAGTVNLRLHYKSSDQSFLGYVDADWAGDLIDRKSFTGYVFFLAGAAFSWECKKQPTIALSSTEAEYVALSTAAREAIYLRSLLVEIGLCREDFKLNVYCDNLGAQQLARNPVFHARTKHIDIKMHHVREVVKKGEIDISYISTNDMVADIFTKNLCRIKHIKFVNMLGLH